MEDAAGATPKRKAPGGAKSLRETVLVHFLLPLVTFLSWGCSLPQETAAVVNEREIPTAELEGAYQKLLSQFGEVKPVLDKELPETRRVLLERLIDREIMLQEAAKRQVRPSAEEVEHAVDSIKGELHEKEFAEVLVEAGLTTEQWRQTVIRNLTLEKLQREAVFNGVTVSDREVENYIRRHRDHREIPERVRASHLLVQTKEEALQARRRILNGEDFAEVAREVSLSPDAEGGGDLGYFSRGQMPQEFDAVVFTLPVGKVSTVIETTYGHHIFLVSDRLPTRQQTEDEVRQKVRHRLLAEKKERVFQQWLKSLRAQAVIRYNPKVIP
jgi:parvulin-like peptidyl-prolyl isomerase